MSARRFATGTSVPSERSQQELDKLLANNGARQRRFDRDDVKRRSLVTFLLSDRMVRLELVNPRAALNPLEPDYKQGKGVDIPSGWSRWTRAGREEYILQGEREAWRRLILIVKAKLVAIAQGGTTVEREFLSDILLPDGTTVHQLLAPQLVQAYADQKMPALLPEYTPLQLPAKGTR